MSERIIPLADAPAPNPTTDDGRSTMDDGRSTTPDAAAQGAQQDSTTFAPDPLNTLKFKPLLVEAVSQVFDPEIPVNIYELGLVYDLDVDSSSNVHVRMTLTAPACPAAQTLPVEVER